MILAVEEIDWCTPADDPESYWPDLARCDFCDEDASEDFMNGMEDPRQFYRILGEDLTVCIHCIAGVEEP